MADERVSPTFSLPSVKLLSRKCGTFDVSQLYEPPGLLKGFVVIKITIYINAEIMLIIAHKCPRRSK